MIIDVPEDLLQLVCKLLDDQIDDMEREDTYKVSEYKKRVKEFKDLSGV